MRKTVRLFSAVGPAQRLGQTIAALPTSVQRALVDVAGREDLSLVAGSWQDDQGGCLVANVVACLPAPPATTGDDSDGDVMTPPPGSPGVPTRSERTLDLRMLDAFPQMSSRDLNLLIVAWDEAAAQAAASTDAALRTLLRSGLTWAGVDISAPPSRGVDDGAEVLTGGWSGAR